MLSGDAWFIDERSWEVNDFLGNIVEKSLTTAQAIRPRTLSLFEPVQVAETTGFAQQPRTEQDYRPAESNVVVTERMQPAPSIPVDQPSRQVDSRVAARQSPTKHAPSEVMILPANETVNQASEITKLTERQPELPDGHRIASPSRPPAAVKGIDRTGQELGVPDHQSKVAGTISERTPVKPAIERVEVEKSVVTQLPQQPIAPLHSRMETTWGKKNGLTQKEASTPTIHVTIGRIEVRATPAPIQNQPKSRAPDAMSLDEYLRRRNGDGR
jgi:hypothetical protein